MTSERKASPWLSVRGRLRPYLPWLGALLLVAAVEAAYWVSARPDPAERTNFLRLDFAKADDVQRLMAFEKLRDLAGRRAQIVQVGDSSGLYGVPPDVVSARLGGISMVNLSVATNLGYLGYYGVAHHALQNNPDAKILVLYSTMLIAPPRGELWNKGNKLIGESIDKEFVDPFYRLFQLPTLAARRTVTDKLYYLDGTFKAADAPLSTNYGYLTFHEGYLRFGGWARETDIQGDGEPAIWKLVTDVLEGHVPENMPPDILRLFRGGLDGSDADFFDWRTLSRRSYMDEIYGAFADLARRHGVTLVILHNPIGEGARDPRFDRAFRLAELEGRLRAWQQANPDVVVQTAFDMWPDERFSVLSHVATPHVLDNGRRVADFLKPVVARLKLAADMAAPGVPAPVAVDFAKTFTGYRWSAADSAGRRQPVPGAGQVLVYAKLNPGADYRAELVVAPESQGCAGAVLATANGKPLTESAPGRLAWTLPAPVIAQDGGLIQLMLSFDGQRVWRNPLSFVPTERCKTFRVARVDFQPVPESAR